MTTTLGEFKIRSVPVAMPKSKRDDLESLAPCDALNRFQQSLTQFTHGPLQASFCAHAPTKLGDSIGWSLKFKCHESLLRLSGAIISWETRKPRHGIGGVSWKVMLKARAGQKLRIRMARDGAKCEESCSP